MPNRTVGVISGGSGSSKFASALQKYSESLKFGFVCNVGDNFWFHSLYVCPDIDIITYALCDKLNEEKGWGLRGDSRKFVELLNSLGYKNWFDLGDEDLALSVIRTDLLRQGFNLSEITKKIAKSFRIKNQIIPATDQTLQTYIDTNIGEIHLQEFWVKNRGRLKVLGVKYRGIEKAFPNSDAISLLSEKVIILPANPITSILPTISLKHVKKRLKESDVLAISPFVGKNVFSGPAANLMRALQIEASSYGVARLYSDFLKLFLVDSNERQEEIQKIKNLGIECLKANIRIRSESDKRSIATEIVSML